jgi:hypothetical protein
LAESGTAELPTNGIPAARNNSARTAMIFIAINFRYGRRAMESSNDM